jgi:hypothetical protein
MNYTNEAWEEEQMENLGCETVSDLIAEVKRLRRLNNYLWEHRSSHWSADDDAEMDRLELVE